MPRLQVEAHKDAGKCHKHNIAFSGTNLGLNVATEALPLPRWPDIQCTGPYEENNGGELLDKPTASVELVDIFSAQARSHLIMLLPFDFIAPVLSRLMYFAYTQASRWPIVSA